MLTDITLGQYFPGNSFLHRLDPRIKIGLLLSVIISIFVFDTPGSYLLLAVFTVAMAVVSGIPAGTFFRSVKPLWWVLLFTFFIHLTGTPGEVIGHLWIWEFTREGMRQGFFISLRLVLLILFSTLLTFTTSPLALTDAIEALLSPLKLVGVPAHELAMMMTIALRFVPTLIEETEKIMKAQQSRGVDFGSGNFLKRLQSLMPIIVPLFISSFRRADELAMAMEARCYRGGEGRTHLKALSVKACDYAAVVVVIALVSGLAVLKAVGI